MLSAKQAILIQRNDGSPEGFNRGWQDFKVGFGDRNGPDGVYWLGNEVMHQLTKADPLTGEYRFKLSIELLGKDGKLDWITYDSFFVDNETQQYNLRLGAHSGTTGNADAGGLAGHTTWAKFSTKDFDNDNYMAGKCVKNENGAGFWYDRCGYMFLNSQNMRWSYPVGIYSITKEMKYVRMYISHRDKP